MRKYNEDPYQKIAIIGSFRKHYDQICASRQIFIDGGLTVLAPDTGTIINPNIEYVLLDTDKDESPAIIERKFMTQLLASDLVYVCNPEGYIGLSVMFELGVLITSGQEIYFQEQPLDPLLKDITQQASDNILTPEKLCEKIACHNQLWRSRSWFDGLDKCQSPLCLAIYQRE